MCVLPGLSYTCAAVPAVAGYPDGSPAVLLAGHPEVHEAYTVYHGSSAHCGGGGGKHPLDHVFMCSGGLLTLPLSMHPAASNCLWVLYGDFCAPYSFCVCLMGEEADWAGWHS